MIETAYLILVGTYLTTGVFFGLQAAPHLEKYMMLQETKARMKGMRQGEVTTLKRRKRVQYATLGAIVVFWPIFAAIVIPLSFKPVRDRIGR